MVIYDAMGDILITLAALTQQSVLFVTIVCFVLSLSAWAALIVDGASKLESVLSVDFGAWYSALTFGTVIIGSCVIGYSFIQAQDIAVDICAAMDNCSLYLIGAY